MKAERKAEEKPNNESVKLVYAKGYNTRICINLRKDNVSGSYYYRVLTRKLTDKKTRHIQETDIIYSVETFTVLMQIGFSQFLNDSFISNKVLNRELAKIKPYKALKDK